MGKRVRMGVRGKVCSATVHWSKEEDKLYGVIGGRWEMMWPVVSATAKRRQAKVHWPDSN